MFVKSVDNRTNVWYTLDTNTIYIISFKRKATQYGRVAFLLRIWRKRRRMFNMKEYTIEQVRRKLRKEGLFVRTIKGAYGE